MVSRNEKMHTEPGMLARTRFLSTRFRDDNVEAEYFAWNWTWSSKKLLRTCLISFVLDVVTLVYKNVLKMNFDWAAAVICLLLLLDITRTALILLSLRRKNLYYGKTAYYFGIFFGFMQMAGVSLIGTLEALQLYATPAYMAIILTVMLSIRVSPRIILFASLPMPIMLITLFFLTPLRSATAHGFVSSFITVGCLTMFYSLSREQDKMSRAEFCRSRELEISLTQTKKEVVLLRQENMKLRAGGLAAPRLNINTPLEDAVSKLKEMMVSLGHDEALQIDAIVQTLRTSNVTRPVLQPASFVLNETEETVSSWLMKEYDVGAANSSMKKKTPFMRSSTRQNIYEVTSMENDNPLPSATMPYLVTWKIGRDLQAELNKVYEWDMFNLEMVVDLSGGTPLSIIAMQVFRQLGLFAAFDIDFQRLSSFLVAVEGEYNPVPYHSSKHAPDVVQAVGCFLSNPSFRDIFSDLEVLGLLVAAIIHDVGHQGSSNSFEVTTRTPRALFYNDRSVWENFHIHRAFILLNEDKNNFVSCLTPSDWRIFRKCVINCVMSTDMTHHFDNLGAFKSRAASEGFGSDEGRQALMHMVLHIADISNPARANPTYMTWVSRVMEEFYQQGDRELAGGLSVSPFMDRRKPQLRDCQVGFLDFIVLPTYTAWAETFPQFANTLENARANRQAWEKEAWKLEMHTR